MKKLATLFISILVLVSFGFAGQACENHASQKKNHGKCEALSQIPQLSAEQIEKMNSLCNEKQKALIEIQAKLKILKLELGELVDSQADQAKIDAKIEELTSQCSRMMKLRIETHKKIQLLLTNEQKAQFKFKTVCGMHEQKDKSQCKTSSCCDE